MDTITKTAEPNLPLDDATLSTSTFETDAVDLLCRQERYLQEIEVSKDVQDTVVVAFQMLTAFLDFAVDHFNDGQHKELEAELQQVLQLTQQFEALAKDEGWKRANRLIDETRERGSELSRLYDELRQGFAALHARFFLRCVEDFRRGPAQVELLQAVDLFLTELKRKW